MEGQLSRLIAEPFPLADMAGQPDQRGRQHGRDAADWIRKSTCQPFRPLRRLSIMGQLGGADGTTCSAEPCNVVGEPASRTEN